MRFLYLTRDLPEGSEVVLVNLDKVLFFQARRGGTDVILNISNDAIDQISVVEDIVEILQKVEND
jgi:DNA-binding LytR/AlgR family response regulator